MVKRPGAITTKNRNKSRELDVEVTDDYRRKFHAIRDRWRGNFPLFCEDRLKVVDKAARGTPIVPLKFNQCQQALYDLIEKIGDFQELRSTKLHDRDSSIPITRLPVEIVILKARKVGVSTFLEARAFWRAALFKAQKCLVMAHERPAAQNIADISQRFDTYWDPDEYPITKIPIARMSDNLIEWEREHGSSIVVETAGTKGGGSSRSFTYHLLHLSEVAFFPPDSPQVAAALTARATYHETYLESTANGTGNLFYNEWQDAMYYEDVIKLFMEGKPLPRWWNGKFRFFWPWYAQEENRVPLLEYEAEFIASTLDEDETALIEEFELDLEQIAWRRREIAGPCSKQTALPPRDYFKQEHPATPEEAFVTKSNAIFDGKKLSEMMTNAKELKPAFLGFIIHDPDATVGLKLVPGGMYENSNHGDNYIEGAQFVQWELPNPNEAYVIGVDAAEGLEHGDWSVISVFSRTNGTKMREVARLRAKTPARELGEVAAFLGGMYNEAYIVCERNAPGNATCEKLVELNYTNIYHHRNIESVTNHDNPEAFTAGFKTTATTKPMLCERGVQGIRDDEIILRHPDAIREWRAYTRLDRKYSAPEGMNDDCVMADLLAYFGMMEAPPLLTEHIRAAKHGEEDKRTVEEIQNDYWRERIKIVREKANKENLRRIDLLQRRVGLRNRSGLIN